MVKGARKLLMTSNSSEEPPPKTCLSSSFGLTSDWTATFLMNFPTDQARSLMTSLTQSLDIHITLSFRQKDKRNNDVNLIMSATTEEVTKGGSGEVGNFLPKNVSNS